MNRTEELARIRQMDTEQLRAHTIEKGCILIDKLSNMELPELLALREQREGWLRNHPIACTTCFGEFRCAKSKALSSVIALYDETIDWKMEMLGYQPPTWP